MPPFNNNVIAFILSIHSIFISGKGAGAAEPFAISNVVEFTVANLDPNDGGAPTNKFRVQLHPSWAPLGVERFQELTSDNFWEGVRIYRNVDDFMSQFGISSDPRIQEGWTQRGPIRDDPVKASNTRGKLSFATSGENSRTTQLFINTGDNPFLDGKGFSPIGEVLPAGDGYGGMEVVDEFFSGYGEQPNQGKIRNEGISYLNAKFPKLSYFEKAVFVADNEDTKEAKDAASSNSVVLDGDLQNESADFDESGDSAEGVDNGSCNNGVGFVHLVLPFALSSLCGLL